MIFEATIFVNGFKLILTKRLRAKQCQKEGYKHQNIRLWFVLQRSNDVKKNIVFAQQMLVVKWVRGVKVTTRRDHKPCDLKSHTFITLFLILTPHIVTWSAFPQLDNKFPRRTFLKSGYNYCGNIIQEWDHTTPSPALSSFTRSASSRSSLPLDFWASWTQRGHAHVPKPHPCNSFCLTWYGACGLT